MPAIRHPFRASAETAAVSDFLQPRAVRMNDVDIGQLKTLPTPMSKRGSVIAARRERDPLAVGRPRRPEITALFRSETLDLARRDIHRPERGRAPAASAHEDQPLPIRRNRRLVVVGRIVRQLFETGAIRLDEKKIRRARAIGSEDDERSMRSPSGIIVGILGGEQWMFVAAVGRGDEETDLAGIAESAGHRDLLRSASLSAESRREGPSEQG